MTGARIYCRNIYFLPVKGKLFPKNSYKIVHKRDRKKKRDTYIDSARKKEERERQREGREMKKLIK